MTNAPKILGTDSLKQTYPKLNQAIDLVNNFQRQIDTIVIEGDSSVEAAQARVAADGSTFITLKERLDTNDSQLTKKWTKEENYYFVGKYQPFKTITEAINKWIADGKPSNTVIFIFAGEYIESISLYGISANFTIKGENSKDVIWRTTRGYYPDHPLTIGGTVLIEGITMIADHSENPGYTFTSYQGGGHLSGGAYALHVDVDGAVGKVIAKNCIFKSYQNSGVGSGTRSNQEIELIDCEVYNFANAAWTEPVDNGAWLYHNSVATGAVNERIKARNTKFFNSNGPAITLENYNADSTYIFFEAINNTLTSGTVTNPDQLVKIKLKNGATANKILPTGNSHGNNNNFLNNVKQYIDHNGFAPSLTDLNLAITGLSQCNVGATNAPTSDSAYYVTTILANSQYGIQTARKMGAVATKYKREKVAGTWQAWSLD